MMIAIPFYIPFTAGVIKYDTIIKQKKIVNDVRIAHGAILNL